MKPAACIIALCLMLFTSAYSNGGESMGFRLKSQDFREGDTIPKKFSCEGDDISPELEWEDPPPGTKSFVLTVEDPDAPMGTFVHWVVYDLPPNIHELDRGIGSNGLRDSIKQGLTDFGQAGYGGPCPPKGHGLHRYIFTLRALDVPTLGVRNGARKSEVERAMKGHVLAEAKIIGVYQR